MENKMKEFKNYGITFNEENILLLKPVGRLLKINKKFYTKNNSYFLIKNDENIKEKLIKNLNNIKESDFISNFDIYVNNIIQNKHILQIEEIESLILLLENKDFVKFKILIRKNIFNLKVKYEVFKSLNSIYSINLLEIKKEDIEKSLLFNNLNLEEKKIFLKEELKMEEKIINNYIQVFYLL
jgi:hypothetical protein